MQRTDIGSQLPNGAILLAHCESSHVVLADAGGAFPYVTWKYCADQGLRSTGQGRYFANIGEAATDFEARRQS